MATRTDRILYIMAHEYGLREAIKATDDMPVYWCPTCVAWRDMTHGHAQLHITTRKRATD